MGHAHDGAFHGLCAPEDTSSCSGCGEQTDNPWSYCDACASALLDVRRPPQFRLNPPHVLEAQLDKIRAYAREGSRTVKEIPCCETPTCTCVRTCFTCLVRVCRSPRERLEGRCTDCRKETS